MRLKLLATWLVVSSVLLTACETMTSSRRVAVSSADQWALLPVKNLSKTPLAGSRAQVMIETHMRARGVGNIDTYQPQGDQSLMALLDDAGQLADAKKWAKSAGYRFGVTGSVHEWEYKNGLDNEPSVGMTLKFIDLHNDRVVWSGTASRTGWGYSNLSSVASKTINGMLAEVSFRRPASSAPAPTTVARRTAPAKPASVLTRPIRPLTLPQPETAAATPADTTRKTTGESNQ